MKREFRPLNMFAEQTDELKRLIEEHPDYKIIVCVASEVVSEEEGSWYAPSLSFRLGEILDIEQDINDEKIYTDRDDFEEDVRYCFECDDSIPEDISEEEFDKLVEKEMQKYEPYWKDVIVIYADI